MGSLPRRQRVAAYAVILRVRGGRVEILLSRLAPRVSRSGPIRDRLTALADDPDPKVRFRVAIALGGWDDDRILAPLARIARAAASTTGRTRATR